MNTIYTAMQQALRQTPPSRDPRILACLNGLRLLSMAARARKFQEPRLLLLCSRLAYRLLEVDHQRLESYLVLIWLFALLREYARAQQLIQHARQACGSHIALQAAEYCLQTLLCLPTHVPAESPQLPLTSHPSDAASSAEEFPAQILPWPALQALLHQQLEKMSPELLQQRWVELDTVYRPLQMHILNLWQALAHE